MIRPMDGVRVLEVAQFTFVPSAGAVLADWGADVIKVEHAETGDAQRGLSAVMGMAVGSWFLRPVDGTPQPGQAQHRPGAGAARGAGGPARTDPHQRRVPDELSARGARRLGIELDDVRKINPDIIYVRGSGFGAHGPDSEKGGYDSTAFWARGGGAVGATPAEFDGLLQDACRRLR